MTRKDKKQKKQRKDRKKEDKKKKESKLSFKRVCSDNFFALKLIHRSVPLYLPIWFGWSVLGALLGFLSNTYILRMAVNSVQLGKDPGSTLLFIIIIVVAETGFSFATGFASHFLIPKMRIKIRGDIQRRLFEKASTVELACYERPEFYDKYVRAMEEALNKVFDVVDTVDQMIWRVVNLSANSLLLYLIDPWLILFGLIPVVLGLLRKVEVSEYYKYVNGQKPIDRKKNYIRRTFYQNDYAKEMRLTSMYKSLFEDYKGCWKSYLKILRRHGSLRTLLGFIIECGMSIFAYLGAILFSIYRTVVQGTMLYGDCVVVINSIMSVSYGVGSIVSGFGSFREHALFIENMRVFLDYKPAIDENEEGDCVPKQGGDLTFEHVSFSYEGQKGRAVEDLNFTIRKGEKIALVGLNGSGKSSLVKLLLHLYEPNEGRILLDGREISSYNLSSYRGLFSVVYQDCKNFSATVGENVLLRRVEEKDKELVENALRESGGYDKVATFEKGVDTVLTKEFDKNGEVLSGGETQKIQLARIFAENRPIAVMDEPSSALDPIAEYRMFQNMMRACEGKTVVFISHRLSSAVHANRIFMMREGRLVECGTHEELMAQNGHYADMFRKQASNYLGKE